MVGSDFCRINEKWHFGAKIAVKSMILIINQKIQKDEPHEFQICHRASFGFRFIPGGSGHVARGAGILVIAPGSTEVFTLVDNLVVSYTLLLQIDGGAYAAQA